MRQWDFQPLGIINDELLVSTGRTRLHSAHRNAAELLQHAHAHMSDDLIGRFVGRKRGARRKPFLEHVAEHRQRNKSKRRTHVQRPRQCMLKQ